MEKLYASPFRVYLGFALLLVVGFFCYLRMPLALFPNSTKPQVGVQVPYGKFTRESFINTYGSDIEARMRSISTKGCIAEKVEGFYEARLVRYALHFSWGDQGDDCLKEVNIILGTFKSRWPEEIQRNVWSYIDAMGTGFFFANIFSPIRSVEEVYEIVEPVIQPKLAAIREANNPVVFNPSETQITIELSPLRMASLRLVPSDIFAKVRDQLQTFGGGVLNQSSHSITIEVGSNINVVEDLKKVLVSSDANKRIFLSEIAEIKLEANSQNRQILKINGTSSVGIFASPAPGKNIRAMSEQIEAALAEMVRSDNIPADITYKVAINPADFIDQSLTNVMNEVWLCSLIAVLVLFVFIGSFAGTFTALLEIPTSIVLSFILMKLTGVQLNLVSLGGLALSVGMNVDASIVVIDSIIKRFAAREGGTLRPDAIVALVADAVREVWTPVLVSTITSLIVFIPLIFTSDLSYAILGDLAKAVIFSHGISLFIALILVPTIRIHMATMFGSFAETHSVPWLRRFLDRLYDGYCTALAYFLERRSLQRLSYLALALATAAVVVLIPPRLPREIISKPYSSIISASVFAAKSTSMAQIEDISGLFEQRVVEKFGEKIGFVFSNIYSINSAFFAIFLRDKHDFQKMMESLQEFTRGAPEARYDFFPFNPAELPIPNPPDWKLVIRSNHIAAAQEAMDSLRSALLEADIVGDVKEDRSGIFQNRLVFLPFEDKMDQLARAGARVRPSDLADVVTLASEPIEVGKLVVDRRVKAVVAKYPSHLVDSVDEIAALPVRVLDKIVPLRALAAVRSEREPPARLRVNGENEFRMEGFLSEKEKRSEREILGRFNSFVTDFEAKHGDSLLKNLDIANVDAKTELSQALRELLLTIGLSVLLIFLVLVLQFASVVHTLIIMLAIPFGIFGVFLSLYIFGSTLSLNSGLGVILLVGITVANSIMLVEMILRLVEEGVGIREAILETARKRIRPILMTSCITILGMLPVAVGHGDGGKVLQPLGIAVCGGLWVSVVFTLFVIPALEFVYLSYLQRKQR